MAITVLGPQRHWSLVPQLLMVSVALVHWVWQSLNRYVSVTFRKSLAATLPRVPPTSIVNARDCPAIRRNETKQIIERMIRWSKIIILPEDEGKNVEGG